MKKFLMATSALALLATANPAFAQEADEGADDGEIIVTAQKRAQNVQDVPVAVSVISAATLEQQGGINIENAQYLVPSLNFRKSGTALNQSLYLRGVGTTTFSIGGEPSVGTVLDGVVLARSGEAFSDLVDIERIEVLRGPQGTLFGKNASAGVVNIVTKRPGDSFGGYAEAGYFFDNGTEYRARAALDIPMGEGTAARVTGFYSDWNGNIFNTALNRRVNGYQRYGFRGVIESKPSDSLTLTLIGDWRKSKDDCCAEVIGAPARNADGTALGAPHQAFFDRAATALPPVLGDKTRQVRQNLLTQALETAWGVSFQADVEFEGPTLTSITAYREYDSNEIRDGDFLGTPYVGIAQSHDFGPQTGNTFTQELRLTSPSGNRLEYVAGLFYYRAKQERTFTRSNIACSASTLAAQGVLTPCSTAAGASTLTFPLGTANFGTTFENVAAFGQATFKASERLRLIAGLRYTYDELKGFHIRRTPVPGASNPVFDQGVYDEFVRQIALGNVAGAQGLAVAASNGIPFRQAVTNNNVSGKAGIQFDASDDLMLYATYSRGYKGPGLNIFFNLNSNGTEPLADETGDSYEGGLKATMLDGKLILNLAGYYAKYKNFQANNPDFVLGQRVTRFSNAGAVSTRGFELDMLFRPSRDFTLSGGIAYTDAKVDRFRLPAGAPEADRVPDGTVLPFSPKFKGSLSGSYLVRTGGFADVEIGAQASYQSSQLSLLVASPLIRANSRIKDYSLVDMSVALVGEDDRFRITFQAKNLFNTSFAASISDGGPLSGGNTGSSSYRYIIPREADRYFGVTAKINFGGQ